MRNIKAGGDSLDAYHCWLMVFRCPSDVFDYCMIYCTAVRSPGSNFPFFCATHELSCKVYGLFKHPDVIRIISRQAGLGLHPVWFWSPWQQSARLRRSCENTSSQKSKITFFRVPECDQRGVTYPFYSSEVSCRSCRRRCCGGGSMVMEADDKEAGGAGDEWDKVIASWLPPTAALRVTCCTEQVDTARSHHTSHWILNLHLSSSPLGSPGINVRPGHRFYSCFLLANNSLLYIFFPKRFPEPSLIEAQVSAEQSQILITLTKTNTDMMMNDPIWECGLCGIVYLCIYIHPVVWILISHLSTGLMCNIYLAVLLLAFLNEVAHKLCISH